MAFNDPSSALQPRATINHPQAPGYVYVPGLGVIPSGELDWNVAAGGYGSVGFPGEPAFDDIQPEYGLQPLQFPGDDWGVPDESINPADYAGEYDDAWTMQPYAGVAVQQTMPPEYRIANPQFYDVEAAEAWSRAHMTPEELEAERLRLLEEQFGSLDFWRTLGRALWQGVSLGWGDEIVARYESMRRGTDYANEVAHQRAVDQALRSVDPTAFGLGEAVGTLGPQIAMQAVPWTRAVPAVANKILQRMIKMGVGGAVTGAADHAGESNRGDPQSLALNALIGALATGPAAALGPGYVAPWWNSFPNEFVRKLISGMLGNGPASAVRGQLDADYYGF